MVRLKYKIRVKIPGGMVGAVLSGLVCLMSCTEEADLSLDSGEEPVPITMTAPRISALTRAQVEGIPSDAGLTALVPVGTYDDTEKGYTYTCYKGNKVVNTDGKPTYVDLPFEEQKVTFKDGTGTFTHTPKLYYPLNSENIALCGLYPATIQGSQGKGWWLNKKGTGAYIEFDGKSDVMTTATLVTNSGSNDTDATVKLPAFNHQCAWLDIYVVAEDNAAVQEWGNITSLKLFTHTKENGYWAENIGFVNFNGANAGRLALETGTPDPQADCTSKNSGIDVWREKDEGISKMELGTASARLHCLAPPLTPDATKGVGYVLKVVCDGKDKEPQYVPVTLMAGNGSEFEGDTRGYRFDVTLIFGSKKINAVCSIGAGTWVEGEGNSFTGRVISRIFKSDQLKMGDYFYSDGTWSDGGLRALFVDRVAGGGDQKYEAMNVSVALPKPAPLPDKKVVGIVYSVQADRVGAKEKEVLKHQGAQENWMYASVMASKTVGKQLRWFQCNGDGEPKLREYKTDLLPECRTQKQIYNDISGLGNTEKLKGEYKENYATYFPAFHEAEQYAAVESKTLCHTGWYLPASGQLWDILRNLAHCPKLGDPNICNNDSANFNDQNTLYGHFTWGDQGDSFDSLNSWLKLVKKDEASLIGGKGWLLCASAFMGGKEGKGIRGRRWAIDDKGIVQSYGFELDNSEQKYGVRPVLVFAVSEEAGNGK